MARAVTSVTEREATQAAEEALARALLARAIDEGRDSDARALLARIGRPREAR